MTETDTQNDESVDESENGIEQLWFSLTGFRRDLLAVISRVEQTNDLVYGLRIKELMEVRYGTEVNHGRLYPNLDALVELGLVEKAEHDKRTNEYALTVTGRDVLEVGVNQLHRDLGAPSTQTPRGKEVIADGGE